MTGIFILVTHLVTMVGGAPGHHHTWCVLSSRARRDGVEVVVRCVCCIIHVQDLAAQHLGSNPRTSALGEPID